MYGIVNHFELLEVIAMQWFQIPDVDMFAKSISVALRLSFRVDALTAQDTTATIAAHLAAVAASWNYDCLHVSDTKIPHLIQP